MAERVLGGTMGDLAEIERRVALLDAALKSIAQRPVDTSDPDWEVKRREAPDALDEAGIRSEAESVLRAMLTVYARRGTSTTGPLSGE